MINYLDILKNSTSDRSGHLHPSAAGSCLNRQLYEYFAVEAIISPESHEIFRIGHMVHDQVQRAWTNAGVLEASEVPVALPEYYIKGHADGVGSIAGKRYVLEIKSINPWGFMGPLPKAEHVEQVQLYMHILGIKDALFLYINKNILDAGVDLSQFTFEQYMNGFYFKIFHEKYNPEIVNRRLEIYSVLKQYVDAGQVIDNIRYNPNDRGCAEFCGYASHCSQRQ